MTFITVPKKEINLSYKEVSPSQMRLHDSRAFFKYIGGPPGSGKSVACLMDILMRAMRQTPDRMGRRRHRAAVFR